MGNGQNSGFGEQSSIWENSDLSSNTWEISIAKDRATISLMF